MKLNLGSGMVQIAGYVAVDFDEEMHPDIVADIAKLPFEDCTIDEIYASHVLEHIPHDVPALEEWHRVLRPGGLISVAVPDINETYMLYKHGVLWGANKLPIDVAFLNATIFGSNRIIEDVPEMQKFWSRKGGDHYQFFIHDMLRDALLRAGFDEVQEVTFCPVRKADLGEKMVTARKHQGKSSCFSDQPYCLRRRDPLPTTEKE